MNGKLFWNKLTLSTIPDPYHERIWLYIPYTLVIKMEIDVLRSRLSRAITCKLGEECPDLPIHTSEYNLNFDFKTQGFFDNGWVVAHILPRWLLFDLTVSRHGREVLLAWYKQKYGFIRTVEEEIHLQECTSRWQLD